MKVRYSYLKQQFSNSEDLWKKLKKFVSTGDFTLGKPLEEFERKFALYLRSKYYREDYRSHFFGATSCEMLSKEILKTFDCCYVSVFEDNENGAEIMTETY